jgi:hypothetical protein
LSFCQTDNRQAWLLALMLGAFAAFNSWPMPVKVARGGRRLSDCFSPNSRPLVFAVLRSFLSQLSGTIAILRRWPKLEKYLNWPFYLLVLPYLGGYRLPSLLKNWYLNLPPIAWLSDHIWSSVAIPVLLAYLAAGLIALTISYRVANHDAKRRLRVVMFGSGVGFLSLLLVIAGNFLGMSGRYPRSYTWLEYAMLITILLSRSHSPTRSSAIK